MKKLLFILFIILSVGCTSRYTKQDTEPYQNLCPLHELLVQAADSVYQIHTITTFKSSNGENLKEQEKDVMGMAFGINKHQLLTVAHAISIDSYNIYTPFGVLTIYISPEDKIKEEVWLLSANNPRIPAKVIYKDKELDFAVLEVEYEIPSPVYSIGNSDDFHILDQVFMISNEDTGKNIKCGHIMNLNYMSREMNEPDTDRFGLYLGIKSGASGSPILLIRDNRLEVGGLVILGDLRLSGYAIKINSIMDIFRVWQNERSY